MNNILRPTQSAGNRARATQLRMTLLAACVTLLFAAPLLAAPKPAKTGTMGTPTLTCGTSSSTSIEVAVTAASTGAAAGFSLQWLTADALAANGGVWLDSADAALCKASFSGNAYLSTFNLAPGQTALVQLGDNLFDENGASSNCASQPLECGTTYAIRGFAHANSTLFRSDFTPVLYCSTLACVIDFGCTYTQGYWKTHGPAPTGNNGNEWPVTSLALGNLVYSDLELQAIFDKPAQGNGLISLAHQLIATKLNIADGADDSSIAAAVAAADALIGDLVVPPVGSGALSAASTSTLTATLDAFNNGLTGPGHCS